MSTDATQPVAILVHGAFAGPWVWTPMVAELEERGHRSVCVTLPGHDEPGSTRPNLSTIGTYVRHLADVVGEQSGPVILAGHSMGGYVIQRFLESQEVAAAVLVASVPHSGTAKSTWHTTMRHLVPAVWSSLRFDTAHLFRDPAVARDVFFTEDTSEAVVAAASASFCSESAIVLSTMNVRPIRTGRIATPVHVVAGRRDNVFGVVDQQRMADLYATDLRIIEASGHNPVLEGHHKAVADVLVEVLLDA